MKKISLLFILCIYSLLSFSQLKSHVDERFELTSIVFRLADAKEYVNNQVKNYAADVDAYFAPYKNHPLIRYVKEIRERDEVAFDAVAGITFQLEIKSNHIGLNPQTDKQAFLQSEPRWKDETINQFIKLLDKFYRETKFKTFYNRHQNLYATTEKRFDEMLQTIHEEWFQSFFGEVFGNPAIYLSLSNGPSNYSFNAYRKDSLSDYGIIIGCSSVDEEGIPYFLHFYRDNKPVYNTYLIQVIIHEFSHHFSNPMVTEHEQEMIAAAEKMFPYVSERMSKYSYDEAKSILYEGLNELFVNMYFQENNIQLFTRYFISGDENRGFVWMRRAIRFMNNFYENRTLYPHISDFMPQLVSFINASGDQIEKIMDEYNHSFPYVVSVFPGLNTTVSADVKEIRVEFSHPMYDCYGFDKTKQGNYDMPKIQNGYFSEDNTIVILKNGESHENAFSVCSWSEDLKTFIIPVELEKGKNYGFRLDGFQSSDTFTMKDDFEVIFKTEE